MTRLIRSALYAASLIGAAGLGAWGMWFFRERPAAEAREGAPAVETAKAAGHGGRAEGVVTLSRAKQEAAGITVEPARLGELVFSKWVTGKIAPNEDRLAHIYSLVEGTVHEVQVGYGDQVKARSSLAVIDSKEVGQAKLALVRNRLDVRIAQVNLEWKQTIAQNTQALIKALDEAVTPQRISEQFRDRPMGKYREELGSAYARLFQTRSEFERAEALVGRKSISQREYEKAKADHETAQATYNSLKEQARFTTEQERIQAEQALEQAQVAEGMSRSALYILGYNENQVATMDPLAQGEEVAHYSITAPFDGAILAKDVVVDERVGPQKKLFDLADLSTVWVQSDIYEKDLTSLSELRRRKVHVRTASYPGRTFEAEVFYTGDVVDPQTRTVRMMAVAGNAERLLKPGLFVEVELPVGTAAAVVQVPKQAVQTDGGETFVFVQEQPGQFVRRDVSVGREGAEVVEIVEGLRGGEPVAVSGAFTLKAELKRSELAEVGHDH